jgi:rhodanese-related sulfurtransferase
MVALRRSAAGARTTDLAGASLERDEAILVDVREADEYAREYVVARVGFSLRAAAPVRGPRQRAGFPAQQRRSQPDRTSSDLTTLSDKLA